MRASAHTRAGVKRRAWAQAREGRAGAKLADRSDAHERKRAQGRSRAQARRREERRPAAAPRENLADAPGRFAFSRWAERRPSQKSNRLGNFVRRQTTPRIRQKIQGRIAEVAPKTKV